MRDDGEGSDGSDGSDGGAGRARLEPATAIAEGVPDHIMLLDLEGRIDYVNWTVPDLTPARVIGTPVTTYVPEPSRDNITRCLARVRTSMAPDRYETSYVADDGTISLWESRVGPVVKHGELAGFAVISSNITERRDAAADRDRFFNLSLDVLAISNDRGILTRVNPAFERTLGYTEDELASTPVFDFIHPDDLAVARDAFNRAMDGQILLDFECRYRRKDGVYRTISWRAHADPERRMVYGVGRDLTDHHALEAQMRQAQKMEAIGQLAGGVAHDFNNLILAIHGNVGFAKRATDPAALREHLEDIERAADRAAELTRQLLTFSRRQPLSMGPVDLTELITNLTKLLRRLIPASIRIDLIPGHGVSRIHADAVQIEQVVMNLCVNARDAMADGGTLTLETENVLVNGRYTEAHPWARPGRYVLLTVTDTGCGMSPEVRERVFEPFFTTKARTGGTGLGLSTVYGIVQAHDGMLHVYSEPDRGTTFKLYFPVADRAAGEVGPKLEDKIVGGEETLLVAEDEASVRQIVVRTLEEAGYTVHSARDGQEALALFAQHGASIALAMLDLVMPGLGGVQVYEQIRADGGDVRVIFTSGYADRSSSVPTLQKPYKPEDLLRRVRAALDEPAP